MSCCGRAKALQRSQAPARPALQPPRPGGAATAPPVAFLYTGQGAIQVIGSMTGRAYRFSSGGRLIVHALDAPAFIGVPGLTPVR